MRAQRATGEAGSALTPSTDPAHDRSLTNSGRLELRLRPEDKATLTRAAAIKRLDLPGCILGTAPPKAEADIAEATSAAGGYSVFRYASHSTNPGAKTDGFDWPTSAQMAVIDP